MRMRCLVLLLGVAACGPSPRPGPQPLVEGTAPDRATESAAVPRPFVLFTAGHGGELDAVVCCDDAGCRTDGCELLVPATGEVATASRKTVHLTGSSAAACEDVPSITRPVFQVDDDRIYGQLAIWPATAARSVWFRAEDAAGYWRFADLPEDEADVIVQIRGDLPYEDTPVELQEIDMDDDATLESVMIMRDFIAVADPDRRGAEGYLAYESYRHSSSTRWLTAAGDLDGDGMPELFVETEGYEEPSMLRTMTIYDLGHAGDDGEPAVVASGRVGCPTAL